MLVYLGCVCFHAQFHTSMRVPVFLDFFCFYHQLVCLNMPVLESLWLYKAAENMCVCMSLQSTGRLIFVIMEVRCQTCQYEIR